MYLFLEREKGGRREGKKDRCKREHGSVASHTHPHLEPNLQPRHVSRPGIEPAVPRTVGRCPAN